MIRYGIVKEKADAMCQLCDIVIATFSGAVQKNDQWKFFCCVCFFRSIETIGKRVVAFDVKTGLEQCSIGLLSAGRRC